MTVSTRRLSTCLTTLALAQVSLSASAFAVAIRPGFDAVEFDANDDGTYPCGENGCPNGPQRVPLGFPVSFFGTVYQDVFVNNNGNMTFDDALGTYTPFDLTSTGQVIVAPFFADVDTRTGNRTRFGTGTVNGRPAFGITWPGVGCYNQITHVLNFFQVILIERSDVGQGDFDIEFNYDSIQWETGTASGGSGSCLGGDSARVGFSNGSRAAGTFFELPGSGVNGALLNGGVNALITSSFNSPVNGRYVFEIRSGNACPPTPPPSCTEDDPCVSLRPGEICPAGDPSLSTTADTLTFEPSGTTTFCPGDQLGVVRVRQGTYTETIQDQDLVCHDDCQTRCGQRCTKIAIQQCYQVCVRRCSNGACLQWQTQCNVNGYTQQCNNDCFSQCAGNWDRQTVTNYYVSQCGYNLDEVLEVRDASPVACTGAVKVSRSLQGAGSAAANISLPTTPGDYDVCVNGQLQRAVSVASCGAPTCTILTPTNKWLLAQGQTAALPVSLVTNDAGVGTYALSLVRYLADDHLPPFLPLPGVDQHGVGTPWVTVPGAADVSLDPNGNAAAFDLLAANAQPTGDQVLWPGLVIRADGPTSCEAVLTVQLQCQRNSDCDDGDVCTVDTCAPTDRDADLRGCVAQPACVVQPGDQCHVALCDPTNGQCSIGNAVEGTPCGDGDACTGNDTCQAGACTGAPVTCTPSDACHAAGVCDPATGLCSDPPAPDGTACDDGNFCTATDECQSGACVGSGTVVCPVDACHPGGQCDTEMDACPVADDGTTCDDGDACTLGETCWSGVCIEGGGSGGGGGGGGVCVGGFADSGANGGGGATCLATYTFGTIAGETYTISTCNGGFTGDPFVSVSGSCSCSNDDAGCGAGAECSCTATADGIATICASSVGSSTASWSYEVSSPVCGEILASMRVTCPPPDQCHDVGICEPATGTCSYLPLPDGTSCDSGVSCAHDACSGGVCTAGDCTAPATPDAPDLFMGSDTGLSSTDDITADPTPLIGGVTEPGATIELSIDGFAGPTVVASATDGSWMAGLPLLADGARSIVVASIDANGNRSQDSAPLVITVDTVAPGAPSQPDLTSASDSGASSFDDVTNVASPSFDGTAEPAVRVDLEIDGVPAHSVQADSTGAWTIALAGVADGTYAVTAAATDVAGNRSVASAALTLVVDTVAPQPPSAPDLDPASDDGPSSTDNRTADNTPAFTGTSEALAQIALRANNAVVATGSADAGGVWSLAVMAPLADGGYGFNATATDLAGNTSQPGLPLGVIIDATGGPPDSDGDGIPNDVDTFPCDATAAADSYTPALGAHGTILAEDFWPVRLDDDYQDAVIAYNYGFKLNAAGQVVELRATFNVTAAGGTIDLGLGLRLPLQAATPHTVAASVGGAPVAMSLPVDTNLTFVAIHDLRTQLFPPGTPQIINAQGSQAPIQSSGPIEIIVAFNPPVALAVAGAPYDVYLFRSSDQAHETHLPQYCGTSMMDPSLFGTGVDISQPPAGPCFIDRQGLPTMIAVPEEVAYPLEQTPIDQLYPAIVPWAASGGTQNPDWFSQPSANSSYPNPPPPTFPGGTGGQIPSDTSCTN